MTFDEYLKQQARSATGIKPTNATQERKAPTSTANTFDDYLKQQAVAATPRYEAPQTVNIPQVSTPAGSVAELLPKPTTEAEMRNYAAQMQQKAHIVPPKPVEQRTQATQNYLDTKIADIDTQIASKQNQLRSATGSEKRRLNRELNALRQQKSQTELARARIVDTPIAARNFASVLPEPEKPTLGERIRNFFKEAGAANAAAAEYQAKQLTDDNITPIEAAALGAAKIPTSIGTGIGKGISKISGDAGGGQRLNDFYSDVTGMQQTAQQENPIAYGAGEMAASLALMGGISKGLGAIKGFEKLPALARSVISGAASLGGARAASEVGAATTGQISGKKYASDVIGSTLGGGLGGGVSNAFTAAGAKLIARTGLYNNTLAKTIVSGLSGSGFAVGNTGTKYIANLLGFNDGEEVTAEQLAKDVLVAFAFGSISYILQNAANGFTTSDPEYEWKYFRKDMTPEEAKALYRKLAFENHPDRGGSTEIMAEINSEYERFANEIVNKAASEYQRSAKASSSGNEYEAASASEEYAKSVYALQELANDGIIAGKNAAEAIEILSAAATGGMAAEAALAPSAIPSDPTSENFAEFLPAPANPARQEETDTQAVVNALKQSQKTEITDNPDANVNRSSDIVAGQKIVLPRASENGVLPTLANQQDHDIINTINNKEEMFNGGREQTGAAGNYGFGEGRMGIQSQRSAVEAGRVDKGTAALGAGNSVAGETEGTGGNRPQIRTDARDREVSTKVKLDGVVDASSFGIEGGDTTQKVRLVESGSTKRMQTAEKITRKSGYKLTPYAGGYLGIGDNHFIQAANLPNGDIIAAADDPEFTIDRLAGHEVCEGEIRKGNVSVNDAIRAVREQAGDEKVDSVLQTYKSLKYDSKELVCDAAGNMNRLAAYAEGNDYLTGLKNDIDDVISVLHDYVNYDGAYDDVPALDGYSGQGKTAEKVSAARITDSENENNGVQFSTKSDVSPEILTIKNQIRESADRLNGMDAVANINVENRKNFSNEKNVAWAIEKLKSSGYAVDRQNFGTIKFGKPQIDRAMRYLDSPGEIGAIMALPKVLKRGVNIGEHADHKDRGYNTVTIAAPIIINGVRGNMAAVVAKTKGYNYRVHRIVMPDGSAFTFREKENAVSGLAKAPTQSEGLVVPTDTASKKTIPQNPQNSNSKFSESDSDSNNNTQFSSASGTEELKTLQQENKRLQKQVDDLRAQLKTTDRSKASFRPGDVTAAARELIRSNSSTMKAEELAQKLEPVYSYIAEGGADGDELTYAGMMERITPVAREIADSAEVMRSTDYDSYKALRDYLKGTKLAISQADRADVNNGDYEGFRKSHFGTMTLGTTGVPVDTAYQELQHIMGTGFFPDDITHPADQLEQIASVMDALRPVAENPFSLDMEEAVNYIANEIADSFFSVRETAPTFADRAKASKEAALARQKENLTANYEDRMTKQEADYEAKIAKQKANMQAAKEAALKRAAQQRADAISKLKAHYAEVNELRRERKQNADARKKLLNLARRLDRMKTTRANRAVIDEVLKNLDTVSVGITGKKLDDLSKLYVWYQNKAATDPDFIRDPGTEAKLMRLSEHRISDMSMDQVRDLTEILRSIEHGIRTQGRVISDINGRTVYRYSGKDAYEMGLEVINDVGNSVGTKRNLLDWLVTNELTPERFVRRITGYNDDDPLYAATKALSDGQRIMMDYQMRAQKKFQRWMDNKKFMRSVRGKYADAIEVTGYRNGELITTIIDPDMRMSLYLHSLNDQNLRHIATGGVRIPDPALLDKGKIEEAYAEGVVIKLTPSNIRAITDKMSTLERTYAHAAKDYFNSMSKDEINAVSEALVGYAIAGVDNYFPIDTDTKFNKKEFDSLKHDGTIEGMGFLKERIDATNPILLRGLTDVLNQSIGMHARYVGLAVPVRNFNMLWNITQNGVADEEGNRERFVNSVQDAIGKKWGIRALEYVEKMMTDIQNAGRPADELDKFFGKLRSNYARSVLSINPSVAIKQAASYPTAAAVLGWKPIINAMRNNGPVDLDLIAKYTPLQWYRGLGYSTQELGDIASRNDSLMKKIMELSFTVYGYEVAPLNWIQMIDLLTTRKLWKASEWYVREHSPQLSKGSDEYYKAVADIYNRVIEETQPNYTTMQRPQILRSDSSLAKSAVAFKTQPFQNFNIMYDAIENMNAKRRAWKNTGDAKSKKAYKDAKKEAGNAVTSQFVSAITFCAMSAAAALLYRKFDRKYGDDDGKVTAESFFVQFAKDLVSNYAGMFTFGTEAYNLASAIAFGDTYYGPDVISVSAITDLLTTVVNLGNYAKSEMEKIRNGNPISFNKMRIKMTDAAEAVSKLFGVPLENVNNIAEAVFKTAARAFVGKYAGNYYALQISYDKGSYTAPFYENLFDCWTNGTSAQTKELNDLMLSEGFSANGIKSSMESKEMKKEGVTSVKDLKKRWPY